MISPPPPTSAYTSTVNTFKDPLLAGNTTYRSKGNRRYSGCDNNRDSELDFVGTDCDAEAWFDRMMEDYELRANGPKGKLYLYQRYWYSPDHDQ